MEPVRRAKRRDWAGWAAAGALAVAIVAAYRATLRVPFLLDDYPSIVNNGSIRGGWLTWSAWRPPPDAGTGGRPLLNFSFSLNHAAGGTSVFGYHAVNLVIHVLAAWVLFGLLRRSLRTPPLAARFGRRAAPLAFAIAAGWALHPVLTESVTYVSQRAESLMGLLYLLTIYFFSLSCGEEAEGGSALARFAMAGLSVVCCFCGMATKEVMATAPLVVLLYDRTFVSGTFAAAWARHWRFHLALASSWLLLAGLVRGVGHRGVGWGQDIAPWGYALTECRAILLYLRLALWPSPLVFDYGGYVAAPFIRLWPAALIVGSGVAASFAAVRRYPALGFAAVCFWLILAPTSSLVPIAGAPVSENRLYLPLAALITVAVLGGTVLAGRWWRWWLALFGAVALCSGIETFRRNRIYSTARSLWTDTVSKRPENARARNNLGLALEAEPEGMPAAVEQFQAALRLAPALAEAHNNLGNAWLQTPDRLPDAMAELQEAVRLKPDYAEAHDNLGYGWSKIPGRLPEAIREFSAAIRLRPDYGEAHDNLGSAWFRTPGHLPEAIAEYREAVRLQPGDAQSHDNLGAAYFAESGTEEAVREFEAAVRLDPRRVLAWDHLGVSRARGGDLPAAIAAFQQEVSLAPGSTLARQHLESAARQAAGRSTSP